MPDNLVDLTLLCFGCRDECKPSLPKDRFVQRISSRTLGREEPCLFVISPVHLIHHRLYDAEYRYLDDLLHLVAEEMYGIAGNDDEIAISFRQSLHSFQQLFLDQLFVRKPGLIEARERKIVDEHGRKIGILLCAV